MNRCSGICEHPGENPVANDSKVVRKWTPIRSKDNDPKHTSAWAQQFFQDRGINWRRTPPESPDCNPIENLCHELKEHWRREVKPRSKEELIQGVVSFWETVDVEKCCKFINHLAKVLPKVVECEGGPSGH